MCILFLSYGTCGCIKELLAECGLHKFKRLTGSQAEDIDESYSTCVDYRIFHITWPANRKCNVNHHAQIEDAIEELCGTADADTVTEKVGYASLGLVDFNWIDDADVLAIKASYDVEQAMEFQRWVDADSHAAALLEGIDPVVIAKK